jgi:hypothetical protein
MSQLGAYDAGLTDDPGCWVQPIEVYWSSRLDPRSADYDPDFAARVEWEEPGPDRDGPELEPGGLGAPGYRHCGPALKMPMIRALGMPMTGKRNAPPVGAAARCGR